MEKETKHVYAQDIVSLYSIVDMINRFRHGIRFFSISRNDVLMEIVQRKRGPI